MAEYIVDAGVVIEYLIIGPHTPHAQAFFNPGQSHINGIRVLNRLFDPLCPFGTPPPYTGEAECAPDSSPAP